MKFNVYSVYDQCAERYLPPFFMSADSVAIRAFINAVSDNTHEFNRNRSDYFLFRIGQFDDDTAVLTRQTEHDLLLLGSDVPPEGVSTPEWLEQLSKEAPDAVDADS